MEGLLVMIMLIKTVPSVSATGVFVHKNQRAFFQKGKCHLVMGLEVIPDNDDARHIAEYAPRSVSAWGIRQDAHSLLVSSLSWAQAWATRTLWKPNSDGCFFPGIHR